ncbi:MAG TPA: hypothetical protein VLH10_04440, partial [Yinghuangia sp.]|nr:hypothetical protein [Yinghuangia sp.]
MDDRRPDPGQGSGGRFPDRFGAYRKSAREAARDAAREAAGTESGDTAKAPEPPVAVSGGASSPTPSPVRRGWSVWTLALRRVRGGIGRVVTLWRRSIQFRVVSSTLVLSATVMILLGVIVVGQVQGGLLDAKVAGATAQAQGGFQVARTQAQTLATETTRSTPQSGPAGGSDVKDWLTSLVDQLASGGKGQY